MDGSLQNKAWSNCSAIPCLDAHSVDGLASPHRTNSAPSLIIPEAPFDTSNLKKPRESPGKPKHVQQPTGETLNPEPNFNLVVIWEKTTGHHEYFVSASALHSSRYSMQRYNLVLIPRFPNGKAPLILHAIVSVPVGPGFLGGQ